MTYRETLRAFTLDRTNCVILITDMQDKVLGATYDHEKVLNNTLNLLKIASIFDVPVINVEHCSDKMGHTNKALLEEIGKWPTYTKDTFSVIRSPHIEKALDEMGRDQVIIVGVEAHICVAQSALDASELGYSVFVVSDATSSIKPDDAKSAFERMRMAGVTILPTQSVMFELLEKAATNEFKKALPFIKSV